MEGLSSHPDRELQEKYQYGAQKFARTSLEADNNNNNNNNNHNNTIDNSNRFPLIINDVPPPPPPVIINIPGGQKIFIIRGGIFIERIW